VNRADVGMIQRRGSACLALESRNPNRIFAEPLRENLDRQFASKSLVLRPIHLSHATFSKDGEDFVMPERRARLDPEHIGRRMSPAVNLKGRIDCFG
jgi:hypothetical protein